MEINNNKNINLLNFKKNSIENQEKPNNVENINNQDLMSKNSSNNFRDSREAISLSSDITYLSDQRMNSFDFVSTITRLSEKITTSFSNDLIKEQIRATSSVENLDEYYNEDIKKEKTENNTEKNIFQKKLYDQIENQKTKEETEVIKNNKEEINNKNMEIEDNQQTDRQKYEFSKTEEKTILKETDIKDKNVDKQLYEDEVKTEEINNKNMEIEDNQETDKQLYEDEVKTEEKTILKETDNQETDIKDKNVDKQLYEDEVKTEETNNKNIDIKDKQIDFEKIKTQVKKEFSKVINDHKSEMNINPVNYNKPNLSNIQGQMISSMNINYNMNMARHLII